MSKKTLLTPGLFIVGSDTDVGKTVVTCCIARALVKAGLKVGVYKPVASGCERENGTLVSDDALLLWHAANKPGDLEAVCPQRFAAPLAPYLAARKEKKQIDERLLQTGYAYWQQRSDIVLVEGAGGILSPLTEEETVADFAVTLGLPLVAVVVNKIGMLNQALLTVAAALHLAKPLPMAALVVNDLIPLNTDQSKESLAADRFLQRSNPEELLRLLPRMPQTRLKHNAKQFTPLLDWPSLAKTATRKS